MNTKHFLPIFLIIFTCLSCTNNIENDIQNDIQKPTENLELYNILAEKDSLLFQIGFNQIDTLIVESLVSEDFEFYHDVHGITDSKEAFLNNIKAIRDLPFRTWRILEEGSLEVYPLFKQNSQVLYGAIQKGEHDFYQQIEGEDARKTNTAKFTHIWVIENNNWKLRRVLSYDHKAPTVD